MRFNAKTLLAIALAIFSASGRSIAVADDAEKTVHFEKQIRPLLVKYCFDCHSEKAKRLEGDLYLDSSAGLMKGGGSGASVIAGNPDASPLIQAIRYETYEMPPRGKLPAAEIQILEDWVQDGAFWPKETDKTSLPTGEFDWKRRKAEHWSWQPVKNVTPPAVKNTSWPANPIDQFILARLETEGLTPAPPAAKEIWLRRVYFDLIGLPPLPEALTAFLDDTSAEAESKVVDALLASPRYGEKWARHWMDLVRYAETYGNEFDYPIHGASHYRDYLIRAFNTDVPYDQMLREHVAGDLLENSRLNPDDQTNESVIATGFWFLGEAVHSPTDVRSDLSTRVENQIDVFSRAFLGLSVACDRCHDHKFDAISKEDYYALYGILNSSHRDQFWQDPHEKIAKATVDLEAKCSALLSRLQQSLQQESEAEVTVFKQYLSATAEILSQNLSGDAVQVIVLSTAEKQRLDAKKLQQWVTAFQDEELKSPSHPLYAVKFLLASSNYEMARQQLQKADLERQKQVDASRQTSLLIGDFTTAGDRDWKTSGPAFALKQDAGLSLNLAASEMQFEVSGVRSSGALSPKLHGTIRSPVFTLTHSRVHTRMRGKNVSVRLVIENYFMDQFTGLLFGDTRKINVDTQGEWKWISQAGDIGNHRGRRAYLEISDHGDGWVEIDSVWLSSEGPPTLPTSRFSQELIQSSELNSQQALVADCAEKWTGLLADAGRKNQSSESIQILNWLLKHQLIAGIDSFRSEHEQLRQTATSIPSPQAVMAMVDGSPVDEPVHIRGSDSKFGDDVARRFLTAISGEDQPVILDGSGRRQLAEQLTNANNPFLSRIIANRLWHHLFGRGLVASVDDFGVMGQAPSHPELLDWLARDHAVNGYSIKKSIRQIVLSRTYRMASYGGDPTADERDPENILLHRMSIRKLSAESLRDAILQTSGRLDVTMYGPSVPQHYTQFMQGRGRPQGNGPLDGAGRRTVYLEVRRNFLNPFLLTFDMPSPFSCMGRRATSNIPAQSLAMMNDPFVVEQAKLWAQTVTAATDDVDERLNMIFLRAYSREPGDIERQAAKEFLKAQSDAYGTDQSDIQVWSDLCHMMFNRKEFLFIE
ncbi:PSD1 and planctomycete cytochrome C domain-containing protein [Planctomicrobium sp. SH527]|uniref:PSD1 and planctomycete cytochrome C domain-containing protein n=1 Tax=Planctomicrobium sp. SH527 TaxID=3448123 RepID=UPI003F5B74BE